MQTSHLAPKVQRENDALWEALFWISEYPNREHTYSENDGIELAEYARSVLNQLEQGRA